MSQLRHLLNLLSWLCYLCSCVTGAKYPLLHHLLRGGHLNDDEKNKKDYDADVHIESRVVHVVKVIKHVDGGHGEQVINDRRSASIDCGAYECHGSSAYCCYLDDGDLGCCWDTYVYQLWWFWVIWVIVFFLILSCSLVCWRRRRAAQYRYVVMANSEYPTYGTVVHTSAANTYYATPSYANPNGPVAPPSAPAAPPSYAASQATKPPAYN